MDRDIIPANLMGKDTEQLQSVSMTRINDQNPPIKPFRVCQVTDLVVTKSVREYVLKVRYCTFFIDHSQRYQL